MALCAANQMIYVSLAVIIILGTICLLLSLANIIIDAVTHRRRL
jgi:hypothetical protein